MNWKTAAVKLCLLVAFAWGLGRYYGNPLLAVAVTLGCLVSYWIYQMHRVQLWLNKPERPPPEIYGLWGDILSQIHQHHRRDKAAQAQLQSTVDYLRDSFASMRDGVLIVDDHGILEWFNEAAQTLLGLREDDRGQSLLNLVRAPQFLRYYHIGDYKEPLQYHTNGDTPAQLLIQITRFGAGDRLLFLRDVTASMRMEQARRDFVANVSHELRTPLTVITGYLGTFLGSRESLDPRFIKPLQQMLQQSDRMENLLKDLLWLSRIESEKGRERRQLVDIRVLLDELHEELTTLHPERMIELQLDTEHRVYGDYRELHSAVSNLVFNAVKYSPDNSVVLIGWHQVGGNYQLSVRDQGIGIDPLHVPRLTERFYRVDDSRSSATGGTGLGLAIVKHVAASHGAKLKVESQLGQGSTFTLVFPDQGKVVTGRQLPESALKDVSNQ